ncbi:sepiapterin reductase [Parasteatoda tepidariorum]|uniref:Sepiapterin reductase n=1 Tax=Parasteatoda tepidariorum TaxID=114398 RepID=A0A2L2YN16_PARTP|nr:sepiapterin reductase [Parasteatoda tepidariorum]
MSEFVQSAVNWQIPTFLIVTGASRGLGQTLAIEFCKKLCDGSDAFLLARDKSKLTLTQDAISSTTSVKPQIVAIDLALPDSPSYEHLLTKYAQKSYSQVILIHNAGTLGDVSKTAANCTSSSEIRDYFDLNVHSAMFLTSAFLKVFEKSERKLIINISSLAAIQPFQGWNLYCTGKAAREMYFRVLAEENKNSVVVLNYAPGPLVTDMLPQILHQALPEIRQQFESAQNQNQLLTCDYTVQRLLGILERSRFKSGDHVDVFDLNY